ncbi:PilW family protein [Psychrobium sp. MM17-31]|uniref:PilW family protein n=1 Tax=Psychrobium sp. MM17-31 TaxID=2917758 RepID=UPI001EF645DC|nr:PilW family protein [Psychrobium sp. MM17-31]MCG7530607.1 PilW family protein [Psychrobium sp. MM17-31]
MRISSHSQQGFSIVELLIALVISVATIGGLFSIYLNTRTAQEVTEASSRVQESGRFAMEYLKRDIRMIGYRGCVSNNTPLTTINSKGIPAGYDPIASELIAYTIDDGWETGTQFEGKTGITSIIKKGTDAIYIARMSSVSAQLSENQSDSSANIKVNQSSGVTFKKDEVIYISDCVTADIFTVTNSPNTKDGVITLTHAQGTNETNNLSKAYQSNANIARYQATLYFIGDTGRKNRQGAPIFALHQTVVDYGGATASYSTQELIEGVENMKILYGEVLASGNIKYVRHDKAAKTPNMQDVSAIQLGLIISSQDEVRTTADTQTYYIAQQAITPQTQGAVNDKRLRHSFNTTVKIRNRRL